MQFTAYYLISPRKALLERLASCSADVAELLGERRFWAKSEGGRTISSAHDHETHVKLLFLGNLVLTYIRGNPAETEIAKIVSDLLGEPPFGAVCFDRWWELQRFEVEETCEMVERHLTTDELNLLQTDSPLVQAWLSELKKQKLAELTPSSNRR